MTEHEQERVTQLLVATAEIMGTELKPGAVMMMVSDLAEYEFAAVAMALTRCRKELTGRLTLKAILDILAPAGGWMTANEAWSIALPAVDERNTVVWTKEARDAFSIAKPLLDAGDKVGARMAFIAAYDRNVAQSKLTGAAPQQEISAGWDPGLREIAVRQAQTNGLLPPPKEQPALPAPGEAEQAAMTSSRERIAAGLKKLAASMVIAGKQRELDVIEERSERMREVNRRFDEQRAAVLAAIEQHEEKGV